MELVDTTDNDFFFIQHALAYKGVDLQMALDYVYLLCARLPEDVAKKPYIKKGMLTIKGLVHDKEFIRLLNHRKYILMNPEYASYYFDKDVRSEDPFKYNKVLEIKIVDVQSFITEFLSEISQELNIDPFSKMGI